MSISGAELMRSDKRAKVSALGCKFAQALAEYYCTGPERWPAIVAHLEKAAGIYINNRAVPPSVFKEFAEVLSKALDIQSLRVSNTPQYVCEMIDFAEIDFPKLSETLWQYWQEGLPCCNQKGCDNMVLKRDSECSPCAAIY